MYRAGGAHEYAVLRWLMCWTEQRQLLVLLQQILNNS
jgi:hypothetical protein